MWKGGLLDMNPMLDELIAQYAQFAIETKNDTMLNQEIKSKIMLNMAQALNLLVPLGEGGQGQEQELMMKQQSHQMEMHMKQEKHRFDLQAAAQKHQLDLETSARKHQTDTVIKSQQAEQKAQHAEANAQMKAKQNSSDSTV